MYEKKKLCIIYIREVTRIAYENWIGEVYIHKNGKNKPVKFTFFRVKKSISVMKKRLK